jgi:hypothetical protein
MSRFFSMAVNLPDRTAGIGHEQYHSMYNDFSSVSQIGREAELTAGIGSTKSRASLSLAAYSLCISGENASKYSIGTDTKEQAL